MSDCRGLTRFIRAQAGVYPQALAEIRAGQKTSHWMWFVFPQIAGLGRSGTARFYAIADLDEAREFCSDELLGGRLAEVTDAMAEWAGRKSALEILGPIDGLKFHSSMTLFELACPENKRYGAAIEAFYDGKRDRATLELLGRAGGSEAPSTS